MSGIKIQIKLGINNSATMFFAVICPPIHNMVVVTSPIGDHAPPALAAMITIPAKSQRSFLSPISFLNKEIITIDVVRLSKAAEKKNVKRQIIQSSFILLVVFILLVITANLAGESISSTIVIAPMRKKIISE